MKADGTVMKLRTPVSVKEILIDYPNHWIFETTAFGLPLPERAKLVAGNLYYLIPFPFPPNELINYNNNSGHFARSRSSSRLHTPLVASRATATDSMKQGGADDAAIDKVSIRGGVRIVSSSYSTTHRSTVHVKLQIRKEELASFLLAGQECQHRIKHTWRSINNLQPTL